MKFTTILFSIFFTVSSFALTSGEPAPDFKLKGASGKNVTLSSFKGKVVVLEWLNHGCPFVRKHYDSGNMQSLQKKFTAQDVIWLSIISSAEGKQGHVDEKGALADKAKNKSSATEILLDPQGTVGKLYEAKTTPHMFVVDKDGKLAYQGAIDSTPDTNVDSVAAAKNYVVAALTDLKAGKKVTQPATSAYGCSVKY
jgi:peroxiredoxin